MEFVTSRKRKRKKGLKLSEKKRSSYKKMKLNEKSYTQPFIEQISYHVYETDIIAPENEETDTASETEATITSIHDFCESRTELDNKSVPLWVSGTTSRATESYFTNFL